MISIHLLKPKARNRSHGDRYRLDNWIVGVFAQPRPVADTPLTSLFSCRLEALS